MKNNSNRLWRDFFDIYLKTFKLFIKFTEIEVSILRLYFDCLATLSFQNFRSLIIIKNTMNKVFNENFFVLNRFSNRI